jgi:uncharacterized membrane protein
MELSGERFSAFIWAASWIFSLLMLTGALRMARWHRLRDPEQLHVYLAACVGLMVLWLVRTEVTPGLSFHLLGMTTLTLMMGWSRAVVGGALILGAVTLAGIGNGSGYALSLTTAVLVPATVTQVALVLVRSWLPKHFFVYIFINAFLVGGLAGLASGYLAVGLLSLGGVYSMGELRQVVLPFFPLMFFPEAILNGWLVTLMVALRPRWVGSFRDEEYLHGK